MKKIKFMVAIVGITLATFGSLKTFAVRTPNNSPGKCIRTGECGKTDIGQNIDGTYETGPQQ